MTFFKNLAKGFVRSAVNQVGRDGGKVVSNKVYGNSHSTPIRIVDGISDQGQVKSINEPNTETRGDLINEGYSPELLSSPIWVYFFLIIGSTILPAIGPFYWIVSAIRNFFKSKVRMYTYIQEPTYVVDKRFKSGMRESGSKRVKKYSLSSFPPSQSEKLIFISKGVLALFIAGAIIYMQYSFYKELQK